MYKTCFLSKIGLLGPVQNLMARQVNNTAIKLQFIAPPSLAGVPIIYAVHISSDDRLTDRAMNITMEEFLFIPHDPCPIYTFSVVSVNGAGQGGMSSVTAVLLVGEFANEVCEC